MILEDMIALVKAHEDTISKIRSEIRSLYEQNTVLLSSSKFKITNDVKRNYDSIDLLFNKKSKIESEVSIYKKEILQRLLG